MAVKALPEAFAQDAERLARFDREARTLAALNHPHIAQIYVRPFPDVESGGWQVSTSGGQTPVWTRSGDELFFLAPDGTIQGVRVEGSSPWRSGTSTKVLQGNYVFPSGRKRRADVRHCARR